MIQDFNDLAEGICLNADICLIGAGALGIAIALEFIDTDIQVLLIESGGLNPEPPTQALYDSEIVGMPHNGIHIGRTRIFGGTTTLWGGQALPLAEIDFQPRPWVEHSGWTISQEQLMPFYRRAEAILQLDQLSYENAPWQKFGIIPPAYDPNIFLPYFSKWSPQPNFAIAYGEKIKRSNKITALIHANATEIVTNSSESQVESLKIKSLSGKSATVIAKNYIICMGGIESARLLLSSNQKNPKGIGNRYDQVGRYFQDHVSFQCGEIIPKHRTYFQNIYDQFYLNKVKYYHKITASKEFQTKQEILNIAAHVYFEHPQDCGIVAAKKILRSLRNRQISNISLADLGYVINDSDDLLKVTKRYLWDKRSFSPKRGAVRLEAHIEQSPNQNSRISLTRDADVLGMPKVVINWQVTDQTLKTVTIFAQALAKEFERLQLGILKLPLHLQPNAPPEAIANWRNFCSDLNHHMGTARIGDNPQTSVVNRHCQVHGINNLYIAGSAVFPTSGYSNPTLTALALGLRLSDRLKK